LEQPCVHQFANAVNLEKNKGKAKKNTFALQALLRFPVFLLKFIKTGLTLLSRALQKI